MLALTPFYPYFPDLTLDSSWVYAMNEAVVTGKVFGKDVIFTYGPLSFVYTHAYHPQTDVLMIIFSLFIYTNFFLTCLILSRGGFVLILMPLFLSQLVGRDSLFFCMPLGFLLLAAETLQRTTLRKSTWACITFILAANSLLPLIKVSFIILVIGCIGPALVLLSFRSRAGAALLAAWTVVILAGAWCYMGQPLSGLPGYFLAQQSIISGYGEGMSVPGPGIDVIIYLVCAFLILVACAIGAFARFGKMAVLPLFGLAIVLFMAFKEGFIRHAGQELVAGSTLLLSSLLFCLALRRRSFAIAVMVGIVGWAAISGARMPVDPPSTFSRFNADISRALEGIRIRMSDSSVFRRGFDEARSEIRKQLPLPAAKGTVDLYPFYLSAVFAADQAWAPRPVIQSYSVYTPSLASLNRAHLADPSAPDRIYFSIFPIDGRYPSLDDGASWPELIARYGVVATFNDFAVMEKRARPVTVGRGASLLDTDDALLGKEILIPTSSFPIWANIEIAPTLFGQVISFLYKLPPLYMVASYADGSKERFRFIPGEGRSGFLLSPTIRNADDFVALVGAPGEDLLGDRRPISIKIVGVAGSDQSLKPGYLWRRRYSIALRELNIPRDRRVLSLLFKPAAPAPSNPGKGGDCAIDIVDGMAPENAEISLKHRILTIYGWAVASASAGRPADKVFVALAAENGGQEVMVEASKTPRGDVNIFFKHPEMGDVGFKALINTTGMHGRYTVSVMAELGDQYLRCEKSRAFIVVSE
jgi:hypothetical protein